MAEHSNKDKVQNLKKTIDDVRAILEERGYPNCILFAVGTPEKDRGAVPGTSFLAGDSSLLFSTASGLMSQQDPIYDFFAKAVDEARKIRNKKNPNVN